MREFGIAVVLVADLNRGSAFRSSPQRDRAEQLLLEALGLDPNRSMAHAAMGYLRRVEDQQAEAQAELETAIFSRSEQRVGDHPTRSLIHAGGRPRAVHPHQSKKP